MNSHARVTPSALPSLGDHPRLIYAVLVLFLATMCFQPPAMGATFNVSDAAGLRAALLTAATNGEDDVIVLAAGTYATGGTTFTFLSNESNTLLLQAANGTTRDQVVLDGGGGSQVLSFGCIGICGAITLQGLTVQGGNSNADGGGVRAVTSLMLSDVSFSGNRSGGLGGAVRGNISANLLTVTNSAFSNNTADSGGAIYGSGTVTSSSFSNNTASHIGGAIAGNGTVTNSIFSNNTATNGSGGAIYGPGIIVNTTFSGNAAAVSGAAIYVFSTSSIVNSVFYGHSTPAVYAQAAYNLYNNLIDASAGIAGSTPIMVGNVAPGATSPFIDAASGNFRLAAGSLAINAGLDPNSTTFANLLLGSDPAPIRQALLTDLDGNPRPTPGTAVDIGAYEFGDNESPTVPTGLSATAASPNQINLAWTASTDNVGVIAYKVYRGGVLIATLGNVTTYNDTGLTASSAYSYTVEACDAAGNCSAQSTPVLAITPAVLVNGACGAANGVASAIAPSSGLCNSGIPSAVTNDNPAQWAWTCAGSAGGTNALCSAPRPDTQSPTVPTGLSATAASPGQINLAWTASTDNVGVIAYKIYRGGVLIATLGNVTTYSDTGLTASTAYSYTLQACDAAGNCSAQSAAASATTPATVVVTFNVSDAAGLRAALLTAGTNAEDDVIVLAAGTYATNGTAFTFLSNESSTLTLRGADGTTRDQVVLDGGGISQVLNFSCHSSCGSINLKGLTIQNGNANNGGGISAYQNLAFSDVKFSGNHSNGSGGAVFGNFMTITNSIFSHNTAGGDGGAIYGYGILTNSLFNNNAAGSNGGAIATFFMLLVNSTFSGNSAGGHGSLIDIYYVPYDPIFNSLFYGFSNSLIINSVFYGNSAPAVFIEPSAWASLYNNLINTSTDLIGTIPYVAGNVAPGTTSPFIDAANGNFRLTPGSLAIDTGLDPNSTTFANLVGSSAASVRQALLTDLDGNPRPTPGTAVDIGAYEFLPTPAFLSQSDCLLNWAERTYPNWFAPAGAMSNTLAPYYYRYYPQTNAYLGTSSADSHVYYRGPLSNNSILDAGALSSWLSTAGCQ